MKLNSQRTIGTPINPGLFVLFVASTLALGCTDPVPESTPMSQPKLSEVSSTVGEPTQSVDELDESNVVGVTTTVDETSQQIESSEPDGAESSSTPVEAENADAGQSTSTLGEQDNVTTEPSGSVIGVDAAEYCALVEIGYLFELDGSDGRAELSEGATLASESGAALYVDAANELLEAIPGTDAELLDAASAFLDQCATEGYERL